MFQQKRSLLMLPLFHPLSAWLKKGIKNQLFIAVRITDKQIGKNLLFLKCVSFIKNIFNYDYLLEDG